jgi:hypothetical protein
VIFKARYRTNDCRTRLRRIAMTAHAHEIFSQYGGKLRLSASKKVERGADMLAPGSLGKNSFNEKLDTR